MYVTLGTIATALRQGLQDKREVVGHGGSSHSGSPVAWAQSLDCRSCVHAATELWQVAATLTS